jgi:hypothetical protein
MPRLPAAGAGRKADPVIISTLPGSPASRSLAEGRRFGEGRGGELHLLEERDHTALDFFHHREI